VSANEHPEAHAALREEIRAFTAPSSMARDSPQFEKTPQQLAPQANATAQQAAYRIWLRFFSNTAVDWHPCLGAVNARISSRNAAWASGCSLADTFFLLAQSSRRVVRVAGEESGSD